jgi:predicted Ser/Thr protein kinase
VELTRPAAEALADGCDPGTRPWKPTHWTVTSGRDRLWVKDVRYSAAIYRHTVGRLLLRREARIYRKAEGLEFVPRFFGRFDRDSLVIAHEPATPLYKLDRTGVDPDFFDRLRGCVRELHRRGIVHLDLRHRGNILVRDDGSPVLIDFESALSLGRNPISRRLLVPLFAWVDFSAILKFQLRCFPETVPEPRARRYRRMRVLRLLWPFGRYDPLTKIRRRTNARRGSV